MSCCLNTNSTSEIMQLRLCEGVEVYSSCLSSRPAHSQHAVSSSSTSRSNGVWTATPTADGLCWSALASVSFKLDSKNVPRSTQYDSFSTGAPPYPPNQYGGGGGGAGGGGRGNYDNFRGQGGYLGKPRNIRWESGGQCSLHVAVVRQLRGSCLSFSHHFRMSRGDPRNIIEYRDLDAPDDMDFF